MDYKKLNYEQCVSVGKDLVESSKEIKYNLCILTIKVCDIQVGGHGGKKEVYSMKKFAEDIGMKHHTLRKWVEEHRNVVAKLPSKPKAEDYKVIRHVFKKVNKDTTTQKVRDLYNEIKKYEEEDYNLLRQIQNAKGIRNFVQQHNLKALNKKDLDQLTELIYIILDNLSVDDQKKVS